MATIWRPAPYFPQRAYREGVGRSPGDNRRISPTENGGDEARRRSSARRDRIGLRMSFTTNQMDYFWAWYRDVLADGIYDFWFPGTDSGAPLGTAGDSAILTTTLGEPILVRTWWLVRFDRRAEPPAFELRGQDYDATFSLTRLL